MAPGASRLARPTFLGSEQLPVFDVPITIQRVCDGDTTTLGTLRVTNVMDERADATS